MRAELVMGTRSGDVDPALVSFIAKTKGLSASEVEPLTEIQQKQVIEKRLGKDAVETLWQRVTGLVDSEGQSICANPLMLSMVISIFKKDGDFAQIDSRFALYDLAVKMMLTRVDFKQIGQRSSGAEADHVNLRLLLYTSRTTAITTLTGFIARTKAPRHQIGRNWNKPPSSGTAMG